MNTIIVKQNEFGGFDLAVSSGDPVRIILVETDRCDQANIKVGAQDCVA